MLSCPELSRGAYKRYHTSVKLFIAAGGNPAIAHDMNIPRTTVASWKKADFSKLVTNPVTGSTAGDFRLFQNFLQDRLGQKLFRTYLSISETFHAILGAVDNSKDIFDNSKKIILKAIENIKKDIGIKNALRLFKLSRRKYDAWLGNISCFSSSSGLCVKNYPGQLLKTEVNTLKRFLTDFDFRKWPLNSVYFEGVRKGLVSFSLSTFHKYAHSLGCSHPVPTHRRTNHKIGIRAFAPNKIWHMDVTIFKPLDHVKVYIYLVADNYSRFILGWRASLKYSASLAWETLVNAYRNYGNTLAGDTIQVLTDGGSKTSHCL